MSEIIFEALDDSPETLGDLIVRLPSMSMLGVEGTGGILIARLPRPSAPMIGLGASMGTLVASLPKLSMLAAHAAGGTLIARLPAIRAELLDASELIPQDGQMDATLPSLSVVMTGSLHSVGTLSVVLPSLRLYGIETAGDWAIIRLPRVGAFAAEGVELESYFVLQQSPGFLMMQPASTNAIDAFVAADAIAFDHIVPAIDGLVMSDQAGSIGHFIRGTTDTVWLANQMAVVYTALATDEVFFAASQENILTRIERVVETLIATGAAESFLIAKNMVVDALILDDLAERGFGVSMIETMEVSDEIVAQLRAYVELVDSIEYGDAVAGNAVFTAIVSESVVFDDEAASNAIFIQSVVDGIAYTGSIRINDVAYAAWVLNPKNRAAWRYDNYGFNSQVKFGDTYYGLMDDGLYEITGKTDNGTAIKASVKTGMLNFGSAQKKRLPLAYLYYSSTGRMVMKVTVVDDRDRKTTYWYEAEGRKGGDRVKVGEGLVSVKWQFTITNLLGADFDVSDMKVLPMMLTRRI